MSKYYVSLLFLIGFAFKKETAQVNPKRPVAPQPPVWLRLLEGDQPENSCDTDPGDARLAPVLLHGEVQTSESTTQRHSLSDEDDLLHLAPPL